MPANKVPLYCVVTFHSLVGSISKGTYDSVRGRERWEDNSTCRYPRVREYTCLLINSWSSDAIVWQYYTPESLSGQQMVKDFTYHFG